MPSLFVVKNPGLITASSIGLALEPTLDASGGLQSADKAGGAYLRHNTGALGALGWADLELRRRTTQAPRRGRAGGRLDPCPFNGAPPQPIPLTGRRESGRPCLRLGPMPPGWR